MQALWAPTVYFADSRARAGLAHPSSDTGEMGNVQMPRRKAGTGGEKGNRSQADQDSDPLFTTVWWRGMMTKWVACGRVAATTWVTG